MIPRATDDGHTIWIPHNSAFRQRYPTSNVYECLAVQALNALVEAEILPTIRRLGIGFVAYSPLGRGFLSGAIRSRSELKPGDWRLNNPRFTEEAIAQNSRLVDLVAEVANEVGATAAQVALAWLLSRDVPLATIPGTRSIERLQENWASQELSLPAKQLDRLEALIQEKVVGERY